MELPKYVIPESLMSSQPVPSRGDHTPREPLNEIDNPDRHGKVTGKRKRTGAGPASLKSVSGRTGLPQYTVPESLQSPHSLYSSRGDLTFQAPPNEIVDPDRHNKPTTSSHSKPSMPMHSQSKPVHLALDAHSEAQNHSSLPPSANVKPSDELLHTITPTHQSLGGSPDLMFQPTAKDLGMEHDYFLGMSHETFFPTPAMTELWGEAPTPNLSWDSAQKPSSLLDEVMTPVELDAATGRSELLSDKRVSDTHGNINTAASLLRGDSQLDNSLLTGARVSHVLKAVAAAGFDTLDDAVVAYYAESLKDDERLRQEQRLNRIRRLPILLKELHLAAQGWGQWQRRSFHEQIIKSTEDIVIAELEDLLAARRSDHRSSTCCTEQSGQACKHKAKDEMDIEAELPNTWTLLTSLSTKYNAIVSKDRQTDVPKMVSNFLAAGSDTET